MTIMLVSSDNSVSNEKHKQTAVNVAEVQPQTVPVASYQSGEHIW